VKIAKATKAAMGGDYPDEAVDRCCSGWPIRAGLGASRMPASTPIPTRASGWACGTGWPPKYPLDKMQPSLADVQHRLLFAQVLEAVRALEEGVLTDIREGDVGAILGWGFAPWSGGPFSWLDIIGAPGRWRSAAA
jgi:3-hydroxyacyl-CoA dehydrogenase/enoyl-CoA hydratase/3-hydroxybutyryl-CoA epimerase